MMKIRLFVRAKDIVSVFDHLVFTFYVVSEGIVKAAKSFFK